MTAFQERLDLGLAELGISSPEQRAAIDLENLAGHERRLSRGQVTHHRGDICRATSAADQCLRDEAAVAFVGHRVAEEPGVGYIARYHSVHGDPRRAEVGGQVEGPAQQCRLGCGVRTAPARKAAMELMFTTRPPGRRRRERRA
jgi:hypothetical protein